MPRLGSDLRRAPSSSHPQDKDFSVQQRPDRVAYHPSSLDSHTSSSAHPRSELNRSRYVPSAAQSSPTSPRGSQHTYDSQLSYAPRQSKPEQSFRLATRTNSYRQSNLSYSTPRVYNSSPLVARTMEVDDGPETPRAAEGTESTTSTTAPSTVWDELDDLKSRIRKLELTGKLPATSGAAVSHASGERPPTATTTATTMSTSPKGGRGHSMSPTYSNGIGTAAGETHPLLQSALANSKLLLSPEVYKALEAAASDALVIAAVMGSVGQSGLMSGAQSVIGSSVATVTDRQLRRKADSMCRSLTELCLALSDDSQLQAVSQALIRPGSRDKEHQNGASNSPQRVTSSSVDGLSRVKSSPRALSRLEARRSSLLANSSLPSPRYAPSEIAAPTQAAMAGRRTSMLLRNRRAGTEELDQDDEEGRFRAPSRAATEIGRLRNSTREYSSQLPLPDVRTPSAASNLPVRRHYVSTSLNSGLSPSTTMPNLAARKYLDRSTPERDTSSVIGRLAEDRGQRIAGLDGMGLGRTGSVDRRRLGNNNTTEKSTAVPIGAYQV